MVHLGQSIYVVLNWVDLFTNLSGIRNPTRAGVSEISPIGVGAISDPTLFHRGSGFWSTQHESDSSPSLMSTTRLCTSWLGRCNLMLFVFVSSLVQVRLISCLVGWMRKEIKNKKYFF
jgi:hypothetical protein